MSYYKIPITSGSFDYPAGCVLLRAYQSGSYMCCEFESITEAGTGWTTMTETEFLAGAPETGGVIEPPQHEIIATSAEKIGTDTIVLTLPAVPITGTLIKFSAPCACSGIAKLRIDGADFSFIDAMGNTVADLSGDTGGVFDAGAMVSFVVDMESSKAYIQNAAKDMTDKSSESMIIAFKNITLAQSEFVPDTTYDTHPYRAVIDTAGVTEEYVADVVFSPADAMSGIFAAVSNTGENCVMIYADSVPAADVSILTIECRRIGSSTGSGSGGGGSGSGTVDESSIASDEEVNAVISDVFG